MVIFFAMGDGRFATEFNQSSPLIRFETEERSIIGARMQDEIAEWLDQHAPDWDEESRFDRHRIGHHVRLYLTRPEHCVEFQITWG